MKREGYGNVACAHTDAMRSSCSRNSPFDLVLLDITMPEMDGYQVLELLKADTTLRIFRLS